MAKTMSQKIIISFICLVFISMVALCQNQNKPIGAYRNPVDFKNNIFFIKKGFIFIDKRSKRFPYRFKVKPKKESNISQNDIYLSIWCIYDGEYIYLNALRHALKKDYIRIKVSGNYCYFMAKQIATISQQQRLNVSQINFGLAGTFITASKIDKENKDREHYVLNIKDATIFLLTKEYVEDLLKNNRKLYYDFGKEKDNESVDVLRKYLDLINKEMVNE